MRRQGCFLTLFQNMLDGVDRSLRNGILGLHCDLIVFNAQHGIKMFFDGLNVTVEHSAEISELFLGKIGQTDRTLQGLFRQNSFHRIVQRLGNLDIDKLPDQFIRADEIDDPIVLGSASELVLGLA